MNQAGSREQQWEGSGVQLFRGQGLFLYEARMFSLSLLGSDRHGGFWLTCWR